MVIIAVFLVLGITWRRHPEWYQQLRQVKPILIAAVLLLYGCMLAVLVLIYDTTLRLCGHKIPLREQTLLTMYSSIANFFGPLQSGPGVRSVYLKKRHNVSLKSYATASILYYALFAGFSGLFLLSGIRPVSRALLFSTGWILAGCFGLWLLLRRKRPKLLSSLTPQLTIRLALATLLQVCLVVLIYYIELRAVGAQVSPSQAIAYTGAANFALFVSLTPGALGFRESFLIFSRHIHQIGSSVVIVANILDRAVYVFFLGILFLLALGLHAKAKLKLEKVTE